MKDVISEDCYIYIDEEEKVRMQCVKCHTNNKLGKQWNGVNGYGSWDINCHNCGEAIHRNKGENED